MFSRRGLLGALAGLAAGVASHWPWGVHYPESSEAKPERYQPPKYTLDLKAKAEAALLKFQAMVGKPLEHARPWWNNKTGEVGCLLVHRISFIKTAEGNPGSTREYGMRFQFTDDGRMLYKGDFSYNLSGHSDA